MRALPAVLLGLAAAVGGCGGGSPGGATPVTDRPAPAGASAAAFAGCTGAGDTGPADAFPAGLLPRDSRVTADGRALVRGSIGATLLALRAEAGRLGLRVAGQDYEGVEAELELEGDAGDVALRLRPAPGCRGVTRVERTSG